MSTRDEFITLSRALAQIRVRAGAADDEVNALIDVAVSLIERRLGFNVVDVEVSAEVTAPGSDDDLVIPHAKVRGALMGVSLSALRARLDDGTDASLIGYVIAHPETDRPGEDTHARLALEFEVLRAQTRAAFDLTALRTIASNARVELDDASYTGGDAFNTAVNLENELNGYADRAPSKIVPTDIWPADYYALTSLEPPPGGWPLAVTQADPLRYYAYTGVAAADIPEEWRLAALDLVNSLWRNRGDTDFDIAKAWLIVDTLIRDDKLYANDG